MVVGKIFHANKIKEKTVKKETSRLLASSLVWILTYVYSIVQEILRQRNIPSEGLAIGLAIIGGVTIYAWAHIDARIRGYNLSRTLKVGILFLGVLLVPVYMIKSRGWKLAFKGFARFFLLFLTYMIAIACTFLGLAAFGIINIDA